MPLVTLSSRKIGRISIDAVIQENHISSGVLTQYPVEDGSAINDHYYNLPDEITMIYGFSNQTLRGQSSVVSSKGTRISSIFDELRRMKSRGDTLQVQTLLKLYQNMVIIDISTSQDKDTSNVLIARVTFQQAVIKNSRTVKYPPEILRRGEVRDRASSRLERGEVDTPTLDTTSNSPEANQYQSTLFRVLGGGE